MLVWPAIDSETTGPFRLAELEVRGRLAVVLFAGPHTRELEWSARDTVATFAEQLRKSPQALLELLRAAGVCKSSIDCSLSTADKDQLLLHLKRLHGAGDPSRKRITLIKRTNRDVREKGQRDSVEGEHRARRASQAATPNKVLLVGSLGRTLSRPEHPVVIYEALRLALGRNPSCREVDLLRPLVPHLEKIQFAVASRNYASLLAHVHQLLSGIAPQILPLVKSLVLKLIERYLHGYYAMQVLVAWERLARTCIAGQLRTKLLRAANVEAASAAWRRRRHKRQFPSCVATIDLN